MTYKSAELSNFDQFWKHVPTLELSNFETLTPPEIFRIKLEDLNASLNYRLPTECFDKQSWDKFTIATDSYSFPHFLNLRYKSLNEPANGDGQGWIYIYSNFAEIQLGRYEEGFLWWKDINFNSRIKIGRTGRHLFKRLKEQTDKAATALARRPVLLGAFWTPEVIKVERLIHSSMAKFKAEESGGTEWFMCPSVEALRMVRKIILLERAELEEQIFHERLSVSLSTFKEHMKNDQIALESSRRQGFSEITLAFCRGKLTRSEEVFQEVCEMIQSMNSVNPSA